MQNFKAYIINLDKDTERMSFMHKQMQNLGIEYERVSAVYGKEYDFGDDYDAELSVKLNGKELTKGELGCAKSHKMCYEKILANKTKINLGSNENEHSETYTLILEDDVELPFNFKEIIENQIKVNNEKIKQGQNSWEYLLFDYVQPGYFFAKHYIESLPIAYRNQKNFLSKIKFIIKSIVKTSFIILLSTFESARDCFYKNKKRGSPVKFYRPLYLAGCYLVNITGAEKLHSLTNPIVYAADRVPDEAKKQKGMKFCAYSPLSVFQKRNDFKSNIGA